MADQQDFQEVLNSFSDATLTKVVADRGAYWDQPHAFRFYEAGKAYCTGEEIDKDSLDKMSGEVDL